MNNITLRNIWRSAKLREKVIVILGIIYVVSPIDIIPEAILGPFGLLDDGGAIFAVIATLWAATNRLRHQKHTIIDQ